MSKHIFSLLHERMGHRVVLVGIVVFAHVAALTTWANAQHIRPAPREISVSVAAPAPTTIADTARQTQTVERAGTVDRSHIETDPQIAAAPAPVVATATPEIAIATPGLPDSEPDFQAAYLNNPAPVYPMVARRMGWQGKVVVSVEVLSSGVAGQVKLHQGSGHEVLDNAALQAVRGWRFSAARQAGQLVDKWFLVPIPFILKETE